MIDLINNLILTIQTED